MSTQPPPPSPLPPEEVIALQLNFLAGLDQEDLLQILTNAVYWVELNPRALLYEQDKPVERVYVLHSGEIVQFRYETVQGRRVQRLTRVVGPGQLLGHYELLFDEAYRTNARAGGFCRLLAFDAQALSRLIYRFPNVRERMVPQKTLSRLRTFPFVASIPMEEPLRLMALGFLAESIKTETLNANQTIFQRGDLEDRVFFLDQGQVQLEGTGQSTHLLGNGAFFGVAASSGGFVAMGSADRVMTHTAITTTQTKLLTVPYSTFVSITGLDFDAVAVETMEARERHIMELDIFAGLEVETRRRLAGFVSHYHFPFMYLLIQQGEEADSFWMLVDGRAAILALDGSGGQLPRANALSPNHFAEIALLGQATQDSTVEAQPGSQWLRLHWRDFEALSRLEGRNLRPLLRVRTNKPVRAAVSDVRPRYDWLRSGETVIIFSRRHWLAFLSKSLPAIAIFIFLAIVFLLAYLIPGPQLLLRVLIGLLLVIFGAALTWSFVDYFNDWLVITNRRVVNQEKVLFVNEWRKEAPLEQIENVDFKTTWLGRLLNYGTMSIQTAATAGTITFDYTANFRELYDIIMAQREQRRRHTSAQSKMTIHRMLEARLGLTLQVPSRVYGDVVPLPPPTGWRGRFFNSLNRPLRNEANNRVIWRKHWMVLIPRLWWPLLTLVILLVFATLSFAGEILGVPDEYRPIVHGITIAVAVATLIALGRVVWVVADWRNDTYEVSDEELLHVDRMPLGLSEDRKSAGLGNIQNVSMSIPTPIHWLFNFGNVTCQTAAELGAFVFFAVPDPRAVAQEILTRMDRYRRREEADAARKRAQELPDWFEMYHRLEPEMPEGRPAQNRRPAQQP